MNYNTFRTAIANAIDSNGIKAITGKVLQDAILSVVDALDLGSLYLGEATTTTRPSSEANGFYLALQTGTYTHFQISVAKGEVALIVKTDSRWKKQVLTVMPYIDSVSKHWIVNGEDSGVLAEGQTGPAAVSPFKGWVDPSSIPSTGQEGDYCYVTDDGATKVWRWNPNATPPAFEETTETPDTDHTQTFASSESVNEVSIDKSHLAHPVNSADPTKPILATAKDVMQFVPKLKGVTAEDTNIPAEVGTNVTTGKYVSGETGLLVTPQSSASSYAYFEIEIPSGIKAIRFLTGTRPSGWKLGYSVGYYDPENGNAYVAKRKFLFDYAASPSSPIEKTLVLNEGESVFMATCAVPSNYSLISLSNFYCYLQDGDSVVDLINQSKVIVEDNFDTNDATKALSAKAGKELNDSLFGHDEYIYGDNISITKQSDWQMYLPVTNLSDNAVKKSSTKAYYLLNSNNDFAGKRILVKGGATNNSYLIFVKNSFGSTTNNSSRTLQWLVENDYLTHLHKTSNDGWISAIEIPAGETRYFDVPENTKSILFAKELVSGNCEKPSEFRIGELVTAGGELPEIKKSIKKIASRGESQLMFQKGKVNSRYEIVDSDKSLISSLIALNGGYHIRIDDGWKIDKVHYYGANGDYLGYHKDKYMTNSDYYPSEFGDASYLPGISVRIEVSRKDNGDVTGTENIVRSFAVLSDRRLSKITAVSPANYAEYLRRIKQITNIEWVCMEKVSALHSEDSWYYLKGLMNIGMPYSEACEYSKYVRGTTDGNVSFRTYITALLNRHSVMYTEDIESGHSASAYEIQYHGLSDHSAPYYGCVCADLTRYSAGVANPDNQGDPTQGTWSIIAKGYKSGNNLIWKVDGETSDIDGFISQLQPMDYIIDKDHYSTISEIFTNEYGEKLFVWSEQNSWNGHATNKVYDYDGLKQRLEVSAAKGGSSSPCCLFRRSAENWFDDVIENAPFISTKWFDYPEEVVVDPDIMPYLGDYCAFVREVTTTNDDSECAYIDKYSDIPVSGAMNNFLALIYARRGAGYDKIRIWKDVNGDITDEKTDYSLESGAWIAQSELYDEDAASDEDWVVVDLKAFTSDKLTVGKYRAQLIDTANNKASGFVHFEMVDITFSVTRPTDETIHCVFDCSSNAAPYRIRKEAQSGLPRATINLTDSEITNKQYDGSMSFPEGGDGNYVKLYVRCDYGTVVMRVYAQGLTPTQEE